jgi:2-polyprenyl-6-methoxyphenol hydroxylase-like FAD-dependent oxidoreductase
MTRDQVPVIIVGAGPVGLALAGDLGWRGIPCLVVERGDGSIRQPRQDLVGVRTMEFCRRWGIVGQVEAAPYPRDYPQDNAYVTQLKGGYELGRYRVPAMRDDPGPRDSPQRRERCPQNMFDPVLRRFAQSFDCVELRYRTRFIGLAQDADGVSVELASEQTGETRRVRARYLVGCDGASSEVRSALGIPMLGNPVLTHTTNVIFRCAGFERLHDMAPAYRYIFLDREGVWATLVAINGRDEWRFSIVGSGEDDRERSEDEIRAAIRRAVGRDFAFELLSVMPWRRRELVAERFQEGRAFIAGDAAHCMSPTGGFGMNTGVGDAVDLSWKLAAVEGGWGGERLLESYTMERRPVAQRNVAEASANLARMMARRATPAIHDPTPEGDRQRRALGREFSEAMSREWRPLGIHLGYVYEDSPLIWPDGTPAPPDDPTSYAPTARPGSRAPHVWLGGGSNPGGARSTLDLFGRGFTLLVLGAAADTDPLVAAARRIGLPLEVARIDDAAVAAAYERRLVLVRPDGHVAWRGDALPAAAALVDRVRGAGLSLRP